MNVRKLIPGVLTPPRGRVTINASQRVAEGPATRCVLLEQSSPAAPAAHEHSAVEPKLIENRGFECIERA